MSKASEVLLRLQNLNTSVNESMDKLMKKYNITNCAPSGYLCSRSCWDPSSPP